MQLWDVTELDAVYEVLNRTDVFVGSGSGSSSSPSSNLNVNQSQRQRAIPRTAVLLPTPTASTAVDTLAKARPLLGVLLSTAELVVYSLSEHVVVQRVEVVPAALGVNVVDCSMQASGDFIAISTLVGVVFFSCRLRWGLRASGIGILGPRLRLSSFKFAP